ncbi:MAG TPA: hypothetical protein VGS27_00560 [Candidatus Sulfotelmatobacter sp.]|nr:hypothetical protein [Candidatus Sulfotelmatobacter sp.]
MFSGHIGALRRNLAILVVFTVLGLTFASASSATLLLEEPYGKLGFFSATGHIAVYLSGVCAETPIVLRPCLPGETGVVISRYDGIAKYDWVAIPLIPYLYAVDRPEDVPLFADAKMTAFLRDRYRRTYLENVAPDLADGRTPGGNWYQLIGSSYDRTIYAFDIETTPEQDAALIRKLNSSPNVSHFHTVSENCADFAKAIINFYYPHALHRSIIADVGMTTPKQMAKRLIKYGKHHPDLQFSRVVIPQVPGNMPRSSTVHGAVDAFFTTKIYIVPSAIISPIFAASVAAVYVGSGASHFSPARGALVYVAGNDPEKPLGHEDIRAYQQQLKHYLAGTYPDQTENVEKTWAKLQSRAKPAVDAEGHPVLRMQVGSEIVDVGLSTENVLTSKASPELVRHLLEARLQLELQRSPHRISETEVARDWDLLQKASGKTESGLRANVSTQSTLRGNSP